MVESMPEPVESLPVYLLRKSRGQWETAAVGDASAFFEGVDESEVSCFVVCPS